MYKILFDLLKDHITSTLNIPTLLYNKEITSQRDEPNYSPEAIYIEFGSWQPKAEVNKYLYKGPITITFRIMSEYLLEDGSIAQSSSLITDLTKELIAWSAILSDHPDYATLLNTSNDYQIFNPFKLISISPDYDYTQASLHIIEFTTVLCFKLGK